MDEERVAELVVSTLTNMAAATAALAVPEATIIAAGSVPALEESLNAAVRHFRQGMSRRQVDVIEAAADATELSAAELVRTVARDERALLFLAEALSAAARAATREKLGALAQSLAIGATNRTALDFESLILRALGDMEAIHVQVLSAFTSTSNELGLGDGSPNFDDVVSTLNRVQLTEHIFVDVGAAIEPVLATLSRHGLLRASSGTWADLEGNATYKITPFGTLCLERLEAGTNALDGRRLS